MPERGLKRLTGDHSKGNYHGMREMPEFVRDGLLPIKGGGLYLKAAYAVLWFRHDHSDFSIETEIVTADENFALMKATIRDESGRALATGHKSCTRQAFPTGWIEKAESGAVARALGFLGYGTEFGELEGDTPTPASPRGSEENIAPVPASLARRTRPSPGSANAPILSTQQQAIRALSQQKGVEMPEGLETMTQAQAAQLLAALQKRER
jgi:hypothetical protein